MARHLTEEDYNRGFIPLLSQLTNSPPLSFEQFRSILATVDKKAKRVLVIERDGKIVATVTVVLDIKFHNGGRQVCRIEDLVVDKAHRRQGLGMLLINCVKKIAKENNCYKITLCCTEQMIDYYTTLGFNKKNTEMAIYF